MTLANGPADASVRCTAFESDGAFSGYAVISSGVLAIAIGIWWSAQGDRMFIYPMFVCAVAGVISIAAGIRMVRGPRN